MRNDNDVMLIDAEIFGLLSFEDKQKLVYTIFDEVLSSKSFL